MVVERINIHVRFSVKQRSGPPPVPWMSHIANILHNTSTLTTTPQSLFSIFRMKPSYHHIAREGVAIVRDEAILTGGEEVAGLVHDLF